MSNRHVFSLKEEAWQTSRRDRAHWNPESRLRKNPVVFTSSGVQDPFQDGELVAVKADSSTEPETTEQGPPQFAANATPTASTSQFSASTTIQASYPRSLEIPASDMPETPYEAEGQELPSSSQDSPGKERPPSTVSSCRSDEEVILFTGRNKGPEKPGPTKLPASERTQELERDTEMTRSGKAPPPAEESSSSSAEEEGDGSDERDEEDDGDEMDEGDGATEDFLANLLASGEQLTAESFTFRDLGASDDEICFSQSDAISGSISLDSDIDFVPAVSLGARRQKKRAAKLGRKGKKGLQPKDHDLFSRYPDGMTMDQVVEELQWFLLSTQEQLSFPPLSKPFRKMLHEMAGRLHLKSKSVGKGDTRRPVLYRTKGTPMYDAGSFEAVTSKITRRFWGPRSKSGAKRARRGGAGFTGYRDGEVVGSHLPELNSENRGRAMLEKMGWSTGMALGSEQNKGILQPVPHVMKRNKAGLG